MAGILNMNLGGSGGILGSLMNSVESVRPHILSQTSGPSFSLGSLKGLSSVLTERPAIFQARLSGIQSAPTIVDKIHTLVTPPGSSTSTSKQYYTETPPPAPGLPGVLESPSNVSFA